VLSGDSSIASNLLTGRAVCRRGNKGCILVLTEDFATKPLTGRLVHRRGTGGRLVPSARRSAAHRDTRHVSILPRGSVAAVGDDSVEIIVRSSQPDQERAAFRSHDFARRSTLVPTLLHAPSFQGIEWPSHGRFNLQSPRILYPADSLALFPLHSRHASCTLVLLWHTPRGLYAECALAPSLVAPAQQPRPVPRRRGPAVAARSSSPPPL
jgi:hypothetical protein